MSVPPISTTFTNPPPEITSLTGIPQLWDLMRATVVSTADGDYPPFIKQPSQPDPDSNALIWLRTDASGRPIAMYANYLGTWRRFYSGLPSESKYFTGDPSIYFDPTGLGLIVPTNSDANTWDGWALCNGNNGTPNLADLFIVSGKEYVDGFWSSSVEGTAKANFPDGVEPQAGGESSQAITSDYLPRLANQVTGFPYLSSGNTHVPAVIVTADHSGGGSGSPGVTDSSLKPLPDYGSDNPKVFPTVPPYYVMAIATFIGY